MFTRTDRNDDALNTESKHLNALARRRPNHLWVADPAGTLLARITPTLKTLVGLSALSAVTAALTLLYSVLAARWLGPEEFARFSAALAVVSIIYGALGPLHNLTVRFSARRFVLGAPGQIRAGYEQLAFAAWWIAGGIALVTVIASPVIEHAVPLALETGWLLVGGLVLLNTPLSVTRGLLRGVQNYHSYGTNIIVEAATRLCAGVLLFGAISSSAEAGLLGYLAGTTVALALGYVQQRYQLSEPAGTHVPRTELWEGIAPMLLLAVAAAGLQHSSGLVAQYTLPAAEAGVFFAALTISRVMLLLVQPFALHALPVLSDLHVRGERVSHRLGGLAVLFTAIGTPLILVCGFFPELIVGFFFSSDYLPAAPLLPLLAAAYLLIALCHLIALGAVASGRILLVGIYFVGLLVLLILFTLRHDSGLTLAQVFFGTASVLFIVLAVAFSWPWRTQTPPEDNPGANAETH